jgi:hypothetical protein
VEEKTVTVMVIVTLHNESMEEEVVEEKRTDRE